MVSPNDSASFFFAATRSVDADILSVYVVHRNVIPCKRLASPPACVLVECRSVASRHLHELGRRDVAEVPTPVSMIWGRLKTGAFGGFLWNRLR